MEIEQLSNLQLSSIKGGEWIYIAGEWYWIDTVSYTHLTLPTILRV